MSFALGLMVGVFAGFLWAACMVTAMTIVSLVGWEVIDLPSGETLLRKPNRKPKPQGPFR